MFFLHLLCSIAASKGHLTKKCLRCMNNTQNFLNGQSRFDLSSYEICANANVCESKSILGTKEIARIAMKTAIRDTISKVEAELNTNENENNFEGTEEILNMFDTFYDLTTNTFEKALADDEIKDLLKQILKKVREVKPANELRESLSEKTAKKPIKDGFSPVKRFWLWLGEIVLNNAALNNYLKTGFENLFGVTVDAE